MSSNKRSTSPVSGGMGSGSVDFILRTAMERASSNKRPIRPKLVDDTLLGDDSDDSDFNVEEQEQWSGSGSDSEEDSNKSSEKASGGSSDSDSEGEAIPKPSTLRETLKKFADQSSEYQPPGKSRPKKTKKVKGKKPPPKKIPKKNEKKVARSERKKTDPYSGSIMDRVFKATSAMRDIRSDIDLKRKICSFCLGEKSDESNEIVECDSCKITVHEGCYGMSDSQSVSSGTGSSSSTEPWFCDFCKNPDSRCICALCPNPGGLLKAAADDQFVHLVCAHYTPGILIATDNKANTGRIPHSKWGNKPCTLCTSVRFANTGVTVKCDAGMCKSYVHISCAQKSGLLSDPTSYGVHDEADPFFASCKLHGQKDQARQRSTLYKVLQEQVRIKREKSCINLTDAAKLNQCRIQEKLKKIRAKVAAKRSPLTSPGNSVFVSVSPNGSKVPYHRPFVPNRKRNPRSLKSCAYSVSRFLQKIENMGEDITSLELEEKNERIVANIKKRWNVLPSLTVEYAAYYFDREARIESLSKQCQELVKANETLNDKQIALSTALENEAVNHMEIMDQTLTMDCKIIDFKGILKALCPGNKSINNVKGLPPKPKSPVRKIISQPKGKLRTKSLGNNGTSMELTKKTPARVSLPPTVSGRFTLQVCATCKKSNQQHLITKCDQCNLHYHLGCLDPPLTRMPRRSRLCGWMCSDCCDEESEETETPVIDTEAPRTLRGRTNIKRPEKYREYEESDDEVVIIKEKPATKIPLKKAVPKPLLQQLVIKSPPLLNLSSIPPFRKIAPKLPLPPSSLLVPAHTLRDLHVKVESLENSPGRTVPRILKRKGENEDSVGIYDSPGAKKEKLSSPRGSNHQIPIIQRPMMKPELANSKRPTPQLRRIAGPSLLKSSIVPPVINLVSPEINHTDIYAIPQTTVTNPVSKNLKIVLSPVNSDHATKNGIPESRGAPHVVPPRPMSPPESTHVKKGSILSPQITSPVIKSPKPGQRKTNSRAIRTPDKDKRYFNSLNMSGQIAAALNYNNFSSGSGVIGKCSTCNKADDKKNLVMCDDCSLEFHFTCVPPYVPYNPKRRGYKWVCERCANSSDEGKSIGEIRESVS